MNNSNRNPLGRNASCLRTHRQGNSATLIGPQHGFGVAHFEGRQLLCEVIDLPPSPRRLLLSLIFDGVLTRVDLCAAWSALKSPYSTAEGIAIEWQAEDKTLERRLLGPLTILTLSQAHQASFDAAIADLARSVMERFARRGDVETILLDVLRAAESRLLTALPSDLYAHVRRDQRLTAVTRECLARQKSGLALASPCSKAHTAPLTVVLRQIDRLDSTYDSTTLNDERHLESIREATSVPTSTPNQSHQRAMMIEALEELELELSSASPALRLIWLWAVSLATEGTERHSRLAPSTIAAYCHVAVEPLLGELSGLDLDSESIETIDWHAIATVVMRDAAVPESQRGKLSAAIDSLFRFLEARWDLPPIKRLEQETVASVPRANFIWRNEIEWIRNHLERLDRSDVYNHQLLVVFALMSDPGVAMRTSEIGHIHVFGISPSGLGQEVRIDPLPGVGTTKTVAGRRTLEPRDPRTWQLLLDWLARRVLEGAEQDDLLFGDPQQPFAVFQRSRLFEEMRSWLRAATGDPTVNLHTLRHTSLTQARLDAASGGQREFHERSAQGGHQSPVTSLCHYVHLYESLVRADLDQLWIAQPLKERQACAWTGMPMGRLRQRKCREPGGAGKEVFWEALFATSRSVAVQDVCDGIELEFPVPPDRRPAPLLGPLDITRYLERVASGGGAEPAALRLGLSEETVAEIRHETRRWTLNQRRRLNKRSNNSDASGAQLPFADGMRHLSQSKLEPVLAKLKMPHGTARVTAVARLRAAIEAWADALVGRYISLDAPHDLAPLFDWLSSAGLQANQLVICHQGVDEDLAVEAANVIAGSFSDGQCRTRLLARRSGRERAYLGLVGAGSATGALATAAISVDGLNAVLLSAWIWCRLSTVHNIERSK